MNEIQKECSELVKTLDEKYNIDRDGPLCLSQMVEELGELAKEVNREKLRGTKATKEKLEEEFGDVCIQFCALASMHGIDLDKVTNKRIKEIIKRNNA